jgi:hypothetical protein
MKHIRIYEQFAIEADPEIATSTELESSSHFETETKDFRPTTDEEEGEYIVTFNNAEGQETTINIGASKEPEYVGNSMISSIDMIQDSSSDGKQYSVVGYYNEIKGTSGAYELKKVLIEEV